MAQLYKLRGKNALEAMEEMQEKKTHKRTQQVPPLKFSHKFHRVSVKKVCSHFLKVKFFSGVWNCSVRGPRMF
jgi:hypothetical protein